jgi:hypothetical protein
VDRLARTCSYKTTFALNNFDCLFKNGYKQDDVPVSKSLTVSKVVYIAQILIGEGFKGAIIFLGKMHYLIIFFYLVNFY